MTPTRPVLVVGAGPVGLVAAIELARRHVPVRIVDTLAYPRHRVARRRRPRALVPAGDEPVPRLPAALKARLVVVGADVDPARAVAERYGFGAAGGLAVIRPDGYLGLLCAPDDTAALQGYARRVVG